MRNNLLKIQKNKFDMFNKLNIKFLKAIPIIILMIFSCRVSAQTIVSLNAYQSTLDPVEAEQFENLISGANPTIYLVDGTLEVFGEGAPLVTISDASSYNMMYNENTLYNQVQLVKLVITNPEETPSSIDLAQLQSFNSLTYFLITFEYNACGGFSESCLASIVESIIQGEGSPVVVLYNLSIPN